MDQAVAQLTTNTPLAPAGAAASGNGVLDGLSPEIRAMLAPDLRPVAFTRADALERWRGRDEVLFPISGAVAVMLDVNNGETVQSHLIGSDGAIGLTTALTRQIGSGRLVTRLPGHGFTLRGHALRAVAQHRPELAKALLQAAQRELDQVSRILACCARHDAPERLADLLLHLQDLARGPFTCTHVDLAEALALQRSTVTAVAITFRRSGLVVYSRGRITVVRPERLAAIACGCRRRAQAPLRVGETTSLQRDMMSSAGASAP